MNKLRQRTNKPTKPLMDKLEVAGMWASSDIRRCLLALAGEAANWIAKPQEFQPQMNTAYI
jgi:hypothetical protein